MNFLGKHIIEHKNKTIYIKIKYRDYYVMQEIGTIMKFWLGKFWGKTYNIEKLKALQRLNNGHHEKLLSHAMTVVFQIFMFSGRIHTSTRLNQVYQENRLILQKSENFILLLLIIRRRSGNTIGPRCFFVKSQHSVEHCNTSS